jgi:hypothetical protein
MRAGAVARALASGVAVHVPPPAAFLEARRPILPVRGEAPPERWREIVKGAVETELDAAGRRA